MDPDLQSLQEVRDLVGKAKVAQQAISGFSQAQIDQLVHAMVEAGAAAAGELGSLAVDETKMGRADSKKVKNEFSTRVLWGAIKGMKTVGELSRDPEKQIIEYAEPAGIVCGVIPCTNPTSTALAKGIAAVKARNAMILSPHPRAVRSTQTTAEVMQRALEQRGGPPNLVQSMRITPTIEATNALMQHRDVKIILATGGAGLVKAAYSAGKPAYGVGPGNVPVVIEKSADIPTAVRMLVESQNFDYGTVCSSEQALIVEQSIGQQVRDELGRQKCYLATPEETRVLEPVVNKENLMNPAVVGQSAAAVARLAGLSLPEDTAIILVPYEGVGVEYPISIEKLCPVLAYYEVPDFSKAIERTLEVLRFGGLGHTSVIHTRETQKLHEFAQASIASRVLVNAPSSQGGIGYATNLFPSLSLGCGTWASNITSDNIGPQHLLNTKRLAYGKPIPAAVPPETPQPAAALPPPGPAAMPEPVGASSSFQDPVQAMREWQKAPRASYPPVLQARTPRGIPPGPPVFSAGLPGPPSFAEVQASGRPPGAPGPDAAPSVSSHMIPAPSTSLRLFTCPVTGCPENAKSHCHGCG